jgi:hypothetical protein
MRKSTFGTGNGQFARGHLTDRVFFWRSDFLHCDHRLYAGAHRKLEHIRTCIVPSRIKFPLCRPRLYGIDLCIQDAFMFAQWPSDEFTVRIHKSTVANVDPLIDIRLVSLLEGISIRNIALPLDNSASKNKDPPSFAI